MTKKQDKTGSAKHQDVPENDVPEDTLDVDSVDALEAEAQVPESGADEPEVGVEGAEPRDDKATPEAPETARETEPVGTPDNEPIELDDKSINAQALRDRFGELGEEVLEFEGNSLKARRGYVARGFPMVLMAHRIEHVRERLRRDHAGNDDYGIKSNDDAPAIVGKVVACGDRKQASAYAICYDDAIPLLNDCKTDVEATDGFTKLIAENKGLDNWRRSLSPSGSRSSSPTDKTELRIKAGKRLDSMPGFEGVASPADKVPTQGNSVLLLGRSTGGGRVKVQYVVDDDGLRKAALEYLGKVPEAEIEQAQADPDAPDAVDAAAAQALEAKKSDKGQESAA